MLKYLKILCLAVVVSAFEIRTASVCADEPPLVVKKSADPEISSRLRALVEKYKLPGIVGGIVHGGDLIAVGVSGVRKFDSPELMTVNDKMHLGSCTKAMTATRIAMLVEEGKLDWGSTLASVFPDEMDSAHPDFHDVTLSQLLTHRAGLPANIFWDLLNNKLSITEKRRAVLRIALKRAPHSKPGTEFRYSNVGYVLAGAMAEKVAGQSWEELIQGGLFQSLEMSSAGFGPPGLKGAVDQPWGHRSLLGHLVPLQEDNSPAIGPAGTVHASLPDWAKFAALHLQGARGEAKLLRHETFLRMQTPPESANYAMGWVSESPEWTKSPGFWHNGSNTMWYSLVWILPRRNLALLVATNRFDEPAQNACNEAVRSLLDYFETVLWKN